MSAAPAVGKAAAPGGMSAVASFVSSISGYIPNSVKDAAGLSPQISEAVRHITWLSVERVLWPPNDTVRFILVLGYSDGFQLWDLQDPAAVREILSKQDKAILQARLLPMPLPSGGGASEKAAPLGVSAAPLVAYLHRGSPNLVRLFSLKAHDDVHLLRLTEPAKALQASRRYFAVGFARQVELYDALNFQALFSVQCSSGPTGGGGPTFALGHRWLAYNLPPQLPTSATPGAGLLPGGARQLPTVMRDGLNYLGQVGQRTLDNMLMPPQEGAEISTAAAVRGGVVAVRDAASRSVIARFEDHLEPVEAMAWDPSGLQLVTCAALGHRVLVHRALLGAEQALVMHDSAEGGLSLGSVVFQHLYTLSRGVTPAVISDVAVSDDGQLVCMSSAKGTAHVFRLPPLHSAGLGHHRAEASALRLGSAQAGALASAELGIGARNARPQPLNLNACCRVRLGSVLLQEGLMPKCGFLGPAAHPATSSRSASTSSSRDAYPRMYVATRAGSLALYSLSPGPPGAETAPAAAAGGGGAAGGAGAGGGAEGSDWQAVLTKEVHTCRPFRHFTERRLGPQDLGLRGPPSSTSAARAASPGLGPHASPKLGPQASPKPSPKLGPRPSPRLDHMRSPHLGPRSPALGPSAPAEAGAAAAAAPQEESSNSKWLSYIEMVTHAPAEVPVWLCPQLSFRTYPSEVPATSLNASLRSGCAVGGCRRIPISRPGRLGDGIRYDGGAFSAPGGEERLSKLFGGALGADVGGGQASPPLRPRAAPEEATVGVSREGGRASLAMAPAWGAIGSQREQASPSLEQGDGVGSGLDLEEVEEDWLKA